ncbi:MAG: integrase core domain-containing protein [Isosphaeraceae bacterium]
MPGAGARGRSPQEAGGRAAPRQNPVAAGSPWENGYIESFHSRLRDEFLERVEFEDVADARAKAFWYRREYNAVRPHSSLGYATPKEFSAACDQKGSNRTTKIRRRVDI